jgi:hypothetical protein
MMTVSLESSSRIFFNEWLWVKMSMMSILVYLFILVSYYKSLSWFGWSHFNQQMISILDWYLRKLNDRACGVSHT